MDQISWFLGRVKYVGERQGPSRGHGSRGHMPFDDPRSYRDYEQRHRPRDFDDDDEFGDDFDEREGYGYRGNYLQQVADQFIQSYKTKDYDTFRACLEQYPEMAYGAQKDSSNFEVFVKNKNFEALKIILEVIPDVMEKLSGLDKIVKLIIDTKNEKIINMLLVDKLLSDQYTKKVQIDQESFQAQVAIEYQKQEAEYKQKKSQMKAIMAAQQNEQMAMFAQMDSHGMMFEMMGRKGPKLSQFMSPEMMEQFSYGIEPPNLHVIQREVMERFPRLTIAETIVQVYPQILLRVSRRSKLLGIKTPLLFQAILSGNNTLINEFVDSCKDPIKLTDYQDDNGNSIFHYLAQSGNTEALEKLSTKFAAQLKIMITQKNNQSQSPLAVAVLSNQNDFVKKATKFIDPSEKDSKKESVLHLAARYNNLQLIQEALDDQEALSLKVRKLNVFQTAINYGSLDVIELLLPLSDLKDAVIPVKGYQANDPQWLKTVDILLNYPGFPIDEFKQKNSDNPDLIEFIEKHH